MPDGASPRSRRRALAQLALVALVACTRTGGGTAANGLHAWTQPDRVRIGGTDEPDSLNKLFANSDASDQIGDLIFAPVLTYDERGAYVPELAREVPTERNGGVSRDGRTIVLHLRHGMTWSDGAPLDARDLRFTWQAVMNPRNDTRLRSGWDDISAIDLPDDDTAVVHLRQPFAAILGIFAVGGAGYPPLPAHLLAGLADINHAPFNERPISSGPYLLDTWNHGSSLEFSANPHYWRGAPRIAHVTYRVIPSADTLFTALQTHDVDVVDTLGDNQIDRIHSLDGYAIDRRLVANWRHLDMNCARPLLTDVRVRRAIAEAVDWDRMNLTIYHGINRRAVSDIAPNSWAAPSIPAVRFDLPSAKRLLEAAGWTPGADGVRRRDGVPLELTVSTTVSKPANVQAELQMQQQLRAAGIALSIKNYPTSLLFAQNGPLYSGRYDLSLTIDTNAPDPDNEGLWSGAFIPPKGGNTSFLDDPVITATSHDAAHTFDRAARRALYQREEERIHDLVPTVFLYWQVAYAAVNSDLKGYRAAQYISSNWNAWEWSY
jgi:peptide/nickel transport system substrate-binding protein